MPDAHQLSESSPLIFVMGATGRVGREIALQLSQAGARLRLGLREPRPVAGLDGAEVILFDVANASTYSALEGVQRLFLMWPPGTNVQRDLKPLIAAAEAHGVQQVVFLSILGAEKIGVVPHRTVERWLEASGLSWVFLRASYFMQNLSTVHQDDIRVRHEIFLPAGHGRTSMVDARDVGAVGAKALLAGPDTPACSNQAYNLTGPAAPTYGEVAAMLSVTLGRRIENRDPGLLEFIRTTTGRGTPLSMALFMAAEYTVAKLGLAGRVTTDVQQVLGRPATSFRRFAEEFRDVWL